MREKKSLMESKTKMMRKKCHGKCLFEPWKRILRGHSQSRSNVRIEKQLTTLERSI
jgi:hypothetical protein